MVEHKCVISAILLMGFLCGAVVAQDKNNPAFTAFSQGTEAFKKGEYTSAVLMLRRAVSYPENFNADTYYMLVTAQMFAEDYKSALQDCEVFIKNFYDSPYLSYIFYHKGRALYFEKNYEKAIIVLSDFCHEYPSHEMLPSALYWMAECFFVNYNYDDAMGLYDRIIEEYPNSDKAVNAQYRVETILLQQREEKLLYLLKETGEEYLAARDKVDTLERTSNFENAQDAKVIISSLQAANDALQLEIKKLQKENDVLKSIVQGKAVPSSAQDDGK